MDAARSHRTPSGDVANEILRAAAALLGEHGPEALTIRRIASVAGVAPMSVYNHFGDKGGVVEALFRSGFTALHDAMEAANAIADPLVALRASGRAYRQFALDRPAVYQVMFSHVIPEFTPSSDALMDTVSSFSTLVTILERCQEASIIVGGDANVLAQHLWSMIHGYVALGHAGISKIEVAEDDFEQFLDRTLLGFAVRPTS